MHGDGKFIPTQVGRDVNRAGRDVFFDIGEKISEDLRNRIGIQRTRHARAAREAHQKSAPDKRRGELRDHGVALLLVEERPRDLLTIADDVVVLELGRIVWRGSASELDESRVTDIYLGQAYAQDDSPAEAPAGRPHELLPTPDTEMGSL